MYYVRSRSGHVNNAVIEVSAAAFLGLLFLFWPICKSSVVQKLRIVNLIANNTESRGNCAANPTLIPVAICDRLVGWHAYIIL